MHFVLRHQFLLKLTLSEQRVEWAVGAGRGVEMIHCSHLSGDTFNEQQQKEATRPPALGAYKLVNWIRFCDMK